MSKDGLKISCTGSAFLSLLTIIFVIGKVFGFIDWSWWIVFLPTLINIGGIFLILFFIFVIMFLIKKLFDIWK